MMLVAYLSSTFFSALLRACLSALAPGFRSPILKQGKDGFTGGIKDIQPLVAERETARQME